MLKLKINLIGKIALDNNYMKQCKLSLHVNIYEKICLELYNLIKTTPLTCSPWLTCHGVGDLKKAHYRSHASDPMSCHKFFAICLIKQYETKRCCINTV
jgi:hypothetical protein